MPIPNGGLITETNRQYYAGAQQFQASSTSSIGQTFTSSFDTDLIFSSSDNASNGYNLNNFKIFTSVDANTWAELIPTASIASTTGTSNTASATNQKDVTIAIANTDVLVGMTILKADGSLVGVVASVAVGNQTFTCVDNLAVAVANLDILTFRFVQPYSEANNVVTIAAKLPASIYVKIQLNENTLWDSNGSYSYTRLYDVIDNFLVAYVGAGKLIPSVKRSDVIFHARRGLQEFSYDTLKSIRSQELTVPLSLTLTMPQDYVNYVRFSWVDKMGVQHTIFPANELTLRPYVTPTQADDGSIVQDSNDSNTELTSQTTAAWNANNPRKLSGAFLNDYNVADLYWQNYYNNALGQRYGLNPQTSQRNGWFIIDDRKGQFGFSSDLKEKLIILEYMSDGNAYDLDLRIPKMAEEALYAYIIYNLLSTSSGVQEYVVQRFKREKSAKLRNAKIRLSNIKLDQIVQVFRNQSKWIKY
jgi:hypothetical protein